MGVDPEKYGMNQEQLKKISKKGGLPKYVQAFEFVKDYAQAVKERCLDAKAFKNENGTYEQNGIKRAAVIFSLKNTGDKITFDKETGLFVSGQRVREKSFDKYLESIENYPRKN